MVLKMAETEPGWGYVRLMHERHIGRVVIARVGIWAAGLHRTSDASYAALSHYFGAKQRAATKKLPK